MGLAGTPEIDKPFSITLKIQNTGKTFAKKVILVFAVAKVRHEKGPNFATVEQITPEQAVNSANLIAPNAVVTATRSLNRGKKLTTEDIRLIESGEVQASLLAKSSMPIFLVLNIGRPFAISSTLLPVDSALITNTTKLTTIAFRERLTFTESSNACA